MKFSLSGLLIAAMGFIVGCGTVPEQSAAPPQAATPVSEEKLLAMTAEVVADPFREGVNKAMAAAELAQTADSVANWEKVEALWGEAVMSMGAVPILSEHYSTAQMKVVEYQKNREYAQKQVEQARVN